MKKKNIGLIDTGTSNIKSVYYALKQFNVEVIQIKEYDRLKLDAIVVPGIGSFHFVMEKLIKSKLDKLILEKIKEGLPSLFICVGMQILFSKSYEFGETEGLGVFKGSVNRFPEKYNGEKTKIPFIGWNKIKVEKKCKLLSEINDKDFCYFTHSFYVKPDDEKIISSWAEQSGFKYVASVSRKNIFATQFHPEKSGYAGEKIYKNFTNEIVE